MATELLERSYTINEEEANIILSTPPKRLNNNKVFNDIHLSSEQKIAHARNILNSR